MSLLQLYRNLFTLPEDRFVAAPPAFPSSGNGLWYKQPGRFDDWASDWLPVGNGFLAATLLGETAQEVTQLNIESLWSGGPFQDPSYNGGNKQLSEQAATAEAMQDIRQSIFDSSSGTIDNIEQLTTDAGAYGSYIGAGYLLSSLDLSGDVSNYFRWLDLDSAVHGTQWTQGNTTFTRETFCSHPAEACIQHINSSSTLPALTFAYSVAAESGIPTPTVICFDNSTLQITGTASDPGMAFEILARVTALSSGDASPSVSCTPSGTNATITVNGAQDITLTWVGGTNYDMSAGDAAHDFSFQGADPHDALLALLTPATASSSSFDSLRSVHADDFASVITQFALDLGQTPDFDTPTDVLKAQYETDVGNTYLEWVLFNYGRFLLATSARGVLPANLQGKWGKDASNPWSADSNINIQMNYWFAELTAMDVVTPLFDYFEKTWVPRGSQTAQVLYNISQGWVTHNEIFGHTGMKGGGNTASWADYPESNAWMMFHVWDHFDFTQDIDWFKAQGWPLLKSAAQFHLQKLVPDLRFNDSTLVVSPCNSPEQVPITLGCAHAQQVIWQLFNAVEKGFPASGDTDTAFLDEVTSKRAQMDKGIHVGSWGQLQEWKVDMDSPTDTHRHLSHLIGLYPGYAITGYNPSVQATSQNLTHAQVLAAAETSLIHRGNGTGPDADSGWEKVWRAACWAQLQNATEFYHELSYAVERNFAQNLFSQYSPSGDPIFQIDANFGYPAALLNGLVQTPDSASLSDVFTVSILPALPAQWKSGSIRNARLRGGLGVSFSWGPAPGLTSLTVSADANAAPRRMRIVHGGQELATFNVKPGMKMQIV
ncbi:glycoside hydrolase family 95 protein [Trametes versicolor FP-101664 SS1]|uniref:glycoside hydrolase family 95 protein n=1 Tax=Trametes versicolor (strain FP-101664) TaxID=717944 RepID=UPI00046244F5|nr:glycoside hydrolase family 95 protein [Trametes versicolor FP-101664 SS1]EIW55988.1 glycoside hydrolase family 95 protein [Trametes versicolor FP-101664 SS1]